MAHRLTIKGQVTIPKEIRDFLGLTEGASSVEFSINKDGSVRVSRAAVEDRRCGATAARISYSGVSPCDRVLALLSGVYA